MSVKIDDAVHLFVERAMEDGFRWHSLAIIGPQFHRVDVTPCPADNSISLTIHDENCPERKVVAVWSRPAPQAQFGEWYLEVFRGFESFEIGVGGMSYERMTTALRVLGIKLA